MVYGNVSQAKDLVVLWTNVEKTLLMSGAGPRGMDRKERSIREG